MAKIKPIHLCLNGHNLKQRKTQPKIKHYTCIRRLRYPTEKMKQKWCTMFSVLTLQLK